MKKEIIDNIVEAINACKKAKESVGTIICPACGNKLSYRRADGYNGHTQGKCETEKCLNWIE